ncbi:Dihydrolipoyl dehydrogenase [Buchnera aphidicola (Neophyllaphis podocarpi)]|uniref:dihydrolipoyl dehydrogenase n=1 Tax=Buchnera aphidicola TaxID=9 RepID=UPI003463B012
MNIIKNNTEVVVIGGGPAGYSAAFRCSDLGIKTIIVEKYSDLGGSCLNVGCVPSKYLLHVSKIIKDSNELVEYGFNISNENFNIDIVKNRKNNIIKNFNSGLLNMSKKRNIRIINGIAEFIDDNTIIVKNDAQTNYINFNNAIIASGSKSIKLPIFEYEKHYIWNSSDALSLPFIPKKLLIVGGGIIGLEMATVYHYLGSKIDIIDNSDKLLPMIDRDIINTYYKMTKKDFSFMLGSNISNIEYRNNTVIVNLIDKNNIQKKYTYDAVLIAVGRYPCTELLNISKIDIKCNSSGYINIDNQMRTNINNIYAIGDVTGQPMFAHKGIHQGHIVAEVIAGYKHYYDPKIIPSIAYTIPEISWVGINEIEANNLGIEYDSVLFPWNYSSKAIIENSSFGITKLIFNKKTNKIIGGSIIGHNAGELISEISLAIEMNCDVDDIALTIHAHPTLYETIGLASQIYNGSITDLPNHKFKTI